MLGGKIMQERYPSLGNDSTAWNLEQKGYVMLDDGNADIAPVCSGRQGFYVVIQSKRYFAIGRRYDEG